MENKEPIETVVFHFNVSCQLWEKFKALTPSNKTLERPVIELIEREVTERRNSRFFLRNLDKIAREVRP